MCARVRAGHDATRNMNFEAYAQQTIPVLVGHYQKTFGLTPQQAEVVTNYFKDEPLIFAQHLLVVLRIGYAHVSRQRSIVRQDPTTTEVLDAFFELVRSRVDAELVQKSIGKIVEEERPSGGAPPMRVFTDYASDPKNWPTIVFWGIVLHTCVFSAFTWNPVVSKVSELTTLRNAEEVERMYTFHFTSARSQIETLKEYAMKEILDKAETSESLAAKTLVGAGVLGGVVGGAVATLTGTSIASALMVSAAPAAAGTVVAWFLSYIGYANPLSGTLGGDQIQSSAALNALRHDRLFGYVGRRPATTRLMRLVGYGLFDEDKMKEALKLMESYDVRWFAFYFMAICQTYTLALPPPVRRRTTLDSLKFLVSMGNDVVYALLAFWIMEDVQFHSREPRHVNESSFVYSNFQELVSLATLAAMRVIIHITVRNNQYINMLDVEPRAVDVVATQNLDLPVSTLGRSELRDRIWINVPAKSGTLTSLLAWHTAYPMIPYSYLMQPTKLNAPFRAAYGFKCFFQARPMIHGENRVLPTVASVYVVTFEKYPNTQRDNEEIVRALGGWMVFSSVSTMFEPVRPRDFVGVCIGATHRGFPIVQVLVNPMEASKLPATWEDVWNRAVAKP